MKAYKASLASSQGLGRASWGRAHETEAIRSRTSVRSVRLDHGVHRVNGRKSTRGSGTGACWDGGLYCNSRGTIQEFKWRSEVITGQGDGITSAAVRRMDFMWGHLEEGSYCSSLGLGHWWLWLGEGSVDGKKRMDLICKTRSTGLGNWMWRMRKLPRTTMSLCHEPLAAWWPCFPSVRDTEGKAGLWRNSRYSFLDILSLRFSRY